MKKSGDRTRHLQYHSFYLTVIGLVTLFFVIIMTISVYHDERERRAREKVDIRDEGERLAMEMERQVWDLSEECLRDPELADLAPLLVVATGPDEIHDSHVRLQEFSKRHPLAEHFFVFQNGEVRFPQRSSERIQISRYNISSKNSAIESQFAAIFKSGESQESHGRYANAINTYQQAYDLSVPDGLKALALKNIAICYTQIGKPTDAVRAYHQLEDRFGNYTDEYNRPLPIIAAIEIQKITDKSSINNTDHFEQLYEQLINGRWLLSEEATKSSQALLEKQLGKGAQEAKETPYLRQFRTARSIEVLLRAEQSSMTDSIQNQAIGQGDAGSQLFYLPLQGKDGVNRIVALSVSRSFVSGPLLDECKMLMQGEDRVSSEFQIVTNGSLPGSVMSVSFRTVFPFLELNLSKQTLVEGQTKELINILVSIASVVMMIVLLGLITTLIIRVSREITLLQMRSDFLTGISHEHKTPLTLILMYSETLLADENLMADERRQCCKVIHREAERLNNLIKNTLLFSAIEKKKEDYVLKEGDLGAVVGKTIKNCTDWLVEQGFTVKAEIAPNLPPVLFDVEKVTQALMNLIDNARKYSNKSRSLNVQLKSDGSEVILDVSDSGPGIQNAEKEKIFERFYRGSNTNSQAGSGLGLFIVEDVMKAHKGRVTVESQVGYGSCFRLVFPASRMNATNET